MSSKNLSWPSTGSNNPFPRAPSELLLATPKIDHFAWRVEQLVQEGGRARDG